MLRVSEFISIILVSLLASSLTALAQTDIFIRGAGKLFPIAVPQLCVESGEAAPGKEIPKVMARDLDLSGYFEVLDPGGYIETPGKCAPVDGFAYSDWSIINALGLVKGVVSAAGSRVRVQLYLHDVAKQKVVLGKEYEGDTTQLSLIAHKFANEIMRFFTGVPGVFGSQIAFSSKVGRFKEIFVMDMDGSNIRQLTNDKSISVSSDFDPAGRQVVFTSYRRGIPDLFMVSLADRRVSQVTRSGQLPVSPKFSRDGGNILLSLTSGAESDIVLIRRDGTVVKRLTRPNGAIDVSPDWSPDGSQVVFCSNRGGGPQIYIMGADGGDARRVSFVNSTYCTSPAWSPTGQRLAFVCRADRGFNIFTSNPDGSEPLQLTSVGNNEDPDWAPNGEYLTFASTLGKGGPTNIALMGKDGSSIKQLTVSRSGDSEPSWGPVLE